MVVLDIRIISKTSRILNKGKQVLCEVDMGRKKKYWMFLIWIVAFSVLSIHSSEAVDELFLTGIVRTVDANSRIVVVDVKSQSCPGLRRFKLDKITDLEGLEGQKVSFSIDSSVCRRDEIYKIMAVTQMPGGGTQ
jgi:hypothetical protein